MKLVVISDSHGNIANLKHVLGFAQKIKAEAIIHCGDWDNVSAVETVLNSGFNIYAVLGNADINQEIGEKLKQNSKKFSERFLEFEADKRKIGVVHNINDLPTTISSLDIIFCGHWHKQKEMTIKEVRVVNPGQLENEISFVVYDTKTNKIDLIRI